MSNTINKSGVYLDMIFVILRQLGISASVSRKAMFRCGFFMGNIYYTQVNLLHQAKHQLIRRSEMKRGTSGATEPGL